MSQDGAFDDVVRGVDGIVHTAGPVNLMIDEPDGELVTQPSKGKSVLIQCTELIIPTTRMVTGILQSAFKYGYVAGSAKV